MNGLRSNSSRPSDRSSLDALNRTIEGLEARIEGLIGATTGRDPRQQPPAEKRPERPAPAQRSAQPQPSPRFDPVNEIRQRQQALDQRWERPQAEAPRAARPTERPAPPVREERNYRASTAMPAPRMRPSAQQEAARAAAPVAARTVAPAVPAAAPGDAAMREIAQALVSLRQELKQDLSEGVAREMQGVRAEIRNIRSYAEDQQFAGDIRDDISRLAASIDQLGTSASPDAEGLRAEFEDLRVLMDQLAREDSVHRIERRWDNVEDTLRNFDTAPLQDEIVSLAYRLDDIKSQLGSMSDSPAVRVLEDKLITIASAVEHLGKHMQPNEKVFTEQFSGLDQRLDEISRAIAAAGNRPAAQSFDATIAQRLENRLNDLSSQIDDTSSRNHPADDLSARIDALTGRIEDLAAERTAAQLGERLDQLSLLLERSQRPYIQPELTSFLTDISSKIDALGDGAVNDALAVRLDTLSRKIETLDDRYSQPQAAPVYDNAFLRLEERLGDIASRLDESTNAVPSDSAALKSLESQISNLSLLISQPSQSEPQGISPELDVRMSAIEDYMASSDEYIIEAARQAAEAVLEAYTRNNLSQSASGSDMAMLSELAGDLRNLENLSRNTEDRTHRTFEALHDTLVQIAGRLDSLDNRFQPPAPAYRDEHPARPNVARQMVSPEASAHDHDDVWADYDSAAMPAAIFPEDGLIAKDDGSDFADEEAERQLVEAIAADTIAPPAAAKPAKVEKKGLLAGLASRFKTSTARPEEAAPAARTQVNPAPSLDPTDALSSEENQLLEPGSGAPDIKKILERVRASQTAQARTAPADGDSRGDFIAAARRAAQAAAQETLPEKSGAPRNAGKADGAAEGSALVRYRRPLLLGIGAILLAMMAMPIVKNFVGSEPAPATAIESPASMGSNGIQGMSTPPVTEPAAVQPAVTVPSEQPVDPTEQAAADGMDAAVGLPDTRIDTRPIGGTQLPQDAPAADVPAAETGAELAQQQPAELPPVTEQVQAIDVPAGIEPASLAQAAARGDKLALFELGARFTDGRGVTADRTEAAKWYKLAADRGLAPAQYRLANMYEKANGVARDLPEAKRYYTMAAEQGNAGAMHNLAVLLASDAAGAPDLAAAANWFSKASELGVRDSQFNLAILYARGSGVGQDIEQSYKWFAIAARDGDTDAGQKRDDVAKAMRPEQLASARAKVDGWKATPLNDDANSVVLPDEWTGAPGVKTSSVDMEKAIRNIQAILNNNGFKAGTPDGKLGKNTVTAIKDFQKSVGQTPDGRITDELVTALLARNK
jgi:localization factor PodJL